MIRIPLRTVSGMNVREHFRVRAKRGKAERQAVALVLGPQKKPALPIVVTLTRIAPSNGLDPGRQPAQRLQGRARRDRCMARR